MKRLVKKTDNNLEEIRISLSNDLGCNSEDIDINEDMIRATLNFEDVTNKIAPQLFTSEDIDIINDCVNEIGSNEIIILVKNDCVEVGLDAENVEIVKDAIELVSKVSQLQKMIEDILIKNTSNVF